MGPSVGDGPVRGRAIVFGKLNAYFSIYEALTIITICLTYPYFLLIVFILFNEIVLLQLLLLLLIKELFLHFKIAEDTEFLTKMNSIGVVGDSTLTAQINYQAQLGGTSSFISSFDVQTVVN